MSGYNVAIDQEDERFLVDEVMNGLAILQYTGYKRYQGCLKKFEW